MWSPKGLKIRNSVQSPPIEEPIKLLCEVQCVLELKVPELSHELTLVTNPFIPQRNSSNIGGVWEDVRTELLLQLDPSFLLPSHMPSASLEIEDVSEESDGRGSKYLTAKERRRERHREANRRNYAKFVHVKRSNPQIRERKRLQMQERRAQAKAKKRRWDPPKKQKAIVNALFTNPGMIHR
ncbi:hypothetical protein B0H11DRAFT_1913105 [Mycena galericulata]|nr:hypothetical protein B0H11DRAFT_1913105 [Mycena galericulata]